jgi:hypothetical protein
MIRFKIGEVNTNDHYLVVDFMGEADQCPDFHVDLDILPKDEIEFAIDLHYTIHHRVNEYLRLGGLEPITVMERNNIIQQIKTVVMLYL